MCVLKTHQSTCAENDAIYEYRFCGSRHTDNRVVTQPDSVAELGTVSSLKKKMLPVMGADINSYNVETHIIIGTYSCILDFFGPHGAR